MLREVHLEFIGNSRADSERTKCSITIYVYMVKQNERYLITSQLVDYGNFLECKEALSESNATRFVALPW